jgi:hypothetical protein
VSGAQARQIMEKLGYGPDKHQPGRLLQQRGRPADRAASMEGDPARRRQILSQIEHKLAEEDARPIIFYPIAAIACGPGSRTRWSTQTAFLTAPGERTSGSTNRLAYDEATRPEQARTPVDALSVGDRSSRPAVRPYDPAP